MCDTDITVVDVSLSRWFWDGSACHQQLTADVVTQWRSCCKSVLVAPYSVRRRQHRHQPSSVHVRRRRRRYRDRVQPERTPLLDNETVELAAVTRLRTTGRELVNGRRSSRWFSHAVRRRRWPSQTTTFHIILQRVQLYRRQLCNVHDCHGVGYSWNGIGGDGRAASDAVDHPASAGLHPVIDRHSSVSAW